MARSTPRLFFAAPLLLVASRASAQINLTADSCIATPDRNLIASGTFSVQPTDAQDNPIYVTGGGLQMTIDAARQTITNGSIPSISIADPSTSVPAAYRLRVTITNAATQKTTVYRNVPVTPVNGISNWCSASLVQTFRNLPFVPVPGPVGATGAAATVTANGSNGSFSVAGPYLRTGSSGMGEWPANQASSQDPGFRISRTLDNSNVLAAPGFSHGMSIDDLFGRDGSTCTSVYADGCAYAVYDTRAQVFGNYRMNHFGAFQAGWGTRSDWTGHISRMFGFESDAKVYGTGTIDVLDHFTANEATFVGNPTISTIHGFFAPDITRGGYPWGWSASLPYGSRWAIWINGNASYFGGPIVHTVNDATYTTQRYPGAIGYYLRNMSTNDGDYAILSAQMGADAGGHSVALKATGPAYSGSPNTSLLSAGSGQDLLFLTTDNPAGSVGTDRSFFTLRSISGGSVAGATAFDSKTGVVFNMTANSTISQGRAGQLAFVINATGNELTLTCSSCTLNGTSTVTLPAYKRQLLIVNPASSYDWLTVN